MSNSNDIHSEAFKIEARELLSELETSLLELEDSPEDTEIIGRVFRAMHTIKGSGAMFGFDDIAGFTHEVETVFDMVRDGKIRVTKTLIDLTLAARDNIQDMLEESEGGAHVDEERSQEIIQGFRNLIPKEGDEEEFPEEETVIDMSPPSEAEEVTYRVRFQPYIDLFINGTNPLCLLDEVKELGDAKIMANTSGIPLLDYFNPEACYIVWDIILTTDKGIDAIKDIFIFVEDSCKLNIQIIDTEDNIDDSPEYKKVGEILIEKGDLKPEVLQKELSKRKMLGESLVESGAVTKAQLESALMEQQVVREIREKRQQKTASTTVRIPSDKLDKLVDLVGELVIVQARLSQTATTMDNPDLVSIAEEVENLTRELQDNTLSIRMLPIGSTFARFKRLVRDLSSELGREIDLITEGGDTELDKTVIDQLNDPMVHLIRNSVDHGIEPPAVRIAAGKDPKGTVKLSAIHSGAHVLIKISDDGKGLNPEQIKAKAVKNGLISPDAQLSQKEIFSLIFEAGFSTAEKVTSVSGRGVGMDVVKRAIESLRGSVDIDSKIGVGTTITLKLPLTLAIIDGLLINLGEEQYVFPLAAVEECVELTADDVAKSHGRRIIRIRGEIVPYIKLKEIFKIPSKIRDLEQVVIADVDDQRIGFVVDHVIGQHQTVIKNLGRMYRDAKGVSGATILGDGSVALILDIPEIVKIAEKEEMAVCS